MKENARKFPEGRCHFWGLDARRNGLEPTLRNRTENGTAESMMLNFAESGHPAFRATIALERGRTVNSVFQLCIYGAVADLCRELVKDSPSTRKHAESENWESMVVPTEFPNAKPNRSRLGRLVWRTACSLNQLSTPSMNSHCTCTIASWTVSLRLLGRTLTKPCRVCLRSATSECSDQLYTIGSRPERSAQTSLPEPDVATLP